MKKYRISGFINGKPVTITNSENLSFAATFDEKVQFQEHKKSTLTFSISDTLENGQPNPFMALIYVGAKIRLHLFENGVFNPYDYIIRNMDPEFYKDIIQYNISAEDFASAIYAREGQGLSIDMTGSLKELAREILYLSRKNLGYRNLKNNYLDLTSHSTLFPHIVIKDGTIFIEVGEFAGGGFQISRDRRINNTNLYAYTFDLVTGVGPIGSSTFDATFKQLNAAGATIATYNLSITENGPKTITFTCLEATTHFELGFGNWNGGNIIVTSCAIRLDEDQFQTLIADSLHLLGDADTDTGSYNEADFMGYVQYNKGTAAVPKRATLSLSNSNLYNALVELAKLFEAELQFGYGEIDAIYRQNTINFINKSVAYKYKGYRLLPTFNLLKLSRTENIDNMNTVLLVRGGDNAYSIVPEIPFAFKQYLYDCIDNDFTGINFFETYSDTGTLGVVYNYDTAVGYVANNYLDLNSIDVEAELNELHNFANAADNIPHLENALYSLDYFYNTGKLKESKYNDFQQRIRDDLRKLNIKLRLYSERYQSNDTALSTKESEINFLTRNLAVENLNVYDIDAEYEYVSATGVTSNAISLGEQMVNGTVVYAAESTNDSIPPEVLTTRAYYIVEATAVAPYTAKLSLTAGGAAITIANNTKTWKLFKRKDNATSSYAYLSSNHNTRVASTAAIETYTADLYSVYNIIRTTNLIELTSGVPTTGSYTDLVLNNYGYTSSITNGIKQSWQTIVTEMKQLDNAKKERETRIAELDALLAGSPTQYLERVYLEEKSGLEAMNESSKYEIGIYTTDVYTPTVMGLYHYKKLFLEKIIAHIDTLNLPAAGIYEAGLYDLLYNESYPGNISVAKEELIYGLYKDFEDYIIEGFYENTAELDSFGLLEQALQIFEDTKYPAIDYGVSIIDVNAVENYEYIDLTIGDKILVQEPTSRLYKSYTNAKYLEVSAINYNLRQPEDTSLTVAQEDETKRILQKLLINISDL